MQITKLKVSNFRSFGMEEAVISLKDMSILIGSNSTGKTTAMQALIKLLVYMQRTANSCVLTFMFRLESIQKSLLRLNFILKR
ncbi:AAA family ATPase [Sporomusa carbonis]|uniref:AAA family ATPase n=1 Tax=Sporomusa carbonis TaxID=3076075 RepID=UPI003C7D946B